MDNLNIRDSHICTREWRVVLLLPRDRLGQLIKTGSGGVVVRALGQATIRGMTGAGLERLEMAKLTT